MSHLGWSTWGPDTVVLISVIFSSPVLDAPTLIRGIVALVAVAMVSTGIRSFVAPWSRMSAFEHRASAAVANGAVVVPVRFWGLGLLGTTVGVGLATQLGSRFQMIVLVLLLVTLLQVAWGARSVAFAVGSIATTLVLRAIAGMQLGDVTPSPWVYVFMGFLSVMVAVGYQRALSASRSSGGRQSEGDELAIEFLDRLIAIGVGASLIAYAVNLISLDRSYSNLPSLLSIPVLFYAQFRFLYVIRFRPASLCQDRFWPTDFNLFVAIALLLLTAYAFR